MLAGETRKHLVVGMARTSAIEAALAAWRDAERRLAAALNGEADGLRHEVARNRDEYQRLSTENMVHWVDRLVDAEDRRSHATPSTLPFHEASRDTQVIGAEIREAARSSDEDTPRTKANHRREPAPAAPGAGTTPVRIDR